ncbi:MAG: precorrin-2 C(20)-methyltransferase, partial [Eggerthellaceae bacterium]|nr:precorrin-2 C(20)-methyltransferase [Eggerthellaceae bacterium]
KVLMKSGRALPKVKETLEKLGMADKASMVVNCGLPNERVVDHIEAQGDEGYFVVVLVGE